MGGHGVDKVGHVCRRKDKVEMSERMEKGLLIFFAKSFFVKSFFIKKVFSNFIFSEKEFSEKTFFEKIKK